MDKLLFGLIVTLIGISIVFLGLVILIGLIRILTAATDGTKKNQTEKKDMQSEHSAASAEQVTEDEPEEINDCEIVAAITAAVSCFLNNEGTFRVKHIRRIAK